MRSSRQKTIAIYVAFVVEAGVLIGLMVIMRNQFVTEQRALKHQTTLTALGHLQGYLTDYLIRHHSLPGPTLHDAMDALEREGTKYYESFGKKYIEPGLDAWGNPIIYELRDKTHAVVRSVGENGVDEHGGGDDIEREVTIPPLGEKKDN
jgi:hypothetical protein